MNELDFTLADVGLGVQIVLQVISTVYCIRTAMVSRRWGWIFLALAALFMVGRRGTALMLSQGFSLEVSAYDRLIFPLVISLFLLLGVIFVSRDTVRVKGLTEVVHKKLNGGPE